MNQEHKMLDQMKGAADGLSKHDFVFKGFCGKKILRSFFCCKIPPRANTRLFHCCFNCSYSRHDFASHLGSNIDSLHAMERSKSTQTKFVLFATNEFQQSTAFHRDGRPSPGSTVE